MSARLLNCTMADYHADKVGDGVPSLSQSIAHTLITESPLHAWTEHPRFGNIRKPSEKPQDTGTLLHKLLLGKGVDIIQVPFDNFRTKAAQTMRDEATAAGHLPIIEREYTDLMGALDKVTANIAAYGILLNGISEQAIEWTEKGDRGPVRCRGMMDHAWLNRGKIVDIKKTRSAHPKAAARAMVEYGMDIQWTAYTSAYASLYPEFAGAVDMAFVFIEVEPPYAVLVARPSGMMRELGNSRWRRAVRLWERCLLDNDWPSYATQAIELDPPAWAMNEELLNDF